MMHSPLIELYKRTFSQEPAIEPLGAAGSNRRYYRLTAPDGQTLIGVEGTNEEENRAFVEIARCFESHQLPTPRVQAVDEPHLVYIQEDLGLQHTFLGNVDLLGYDKKDQPCKCWQWEKTDAIAPAGALNSTIGDLLDFAAINLDGSLPYLSMCHEIHGPCEKNANSGLAWRLEKDSPISWHTGSAGAFSAWLGLNRETKTAVAVAVNYGLVNAEQIGFAVIKGLKS